MKGFMHVVEILLVIVLVFVAFAQFSGIPSMSSDSASTKLHILADDSLRAIDAKGVDWFNGTAVANEFNRTLGENMIYSITLNNVIKPRITIGCLCNGADFARVQSLLSPGWFKINGVNTSFDVVQVTDPGKLFSLDFDLALIYGYRDINGNDFYALRNFLGYGKGVVEIFDALGTDSMNAQRDIFGIAAGAKTSDGSSIIFSESSADVSRETGKIYKYYSHIPKFYDSFENLDQWSGAGDIAGIGNPLPSVKLSGNDCVSENVFLFTRDTATIGSGDLDFDVYLSPGSSVLVGFGKGGGYDYFASLSSNRTNGYDAFFRRSPMQAIGTNASHLTQPQKWSHIKISLAANEFVLYNNGERVASAPAEDLASSNATLINKCGDAYVDNLRLTYDDAELPNFLAGENITQAVPDPGKVLVLQKDSRLPACVINYNVQGINNGRTAWISSSSATGEYKSLVKSIVSWAAGDDYRTVKADIKKPVSSYIYKSVGNEMMQNAKITVELGYLY
jgi:hypothetical protein